MNREEVAGGYVFRTSKIIPNIDYIREAINETVNQMPRKIASELREELIEGIIGCVRDGVYSYESKLFPVIANEIEEVIKEFEIKGYEVEIKIVGTMIGKRYCVILTIPK